MRICYDCCGTRFESEVCPSCGQLGEIVVESKRVLILGIDGYLGWPLAQYLARRGHVVGGVDAGLRREWVRGMGSHSAIPVVSSIERANAFKEHYSGTVWAWWDLNLLNYDLVTGVISEFQPEAIVHLGECPSAPYSMKSAGHAAFVQHNNVVGTLNVLFAMRDHAPEAHLVKLGTMGEYGTPNLDIPEGFFEVEYRGRKDTLPFPRQAGSFYHLSKVHDTHNIIFACRTWGLRSTDIMQGVVYGTHFDSVEDDRLLTRLDFDEAFGTVLNRFCCQAVISEPLTVYGAGGQKRGFLPLRDSMQCMTLAIENPPEPGEYRTFNQFEDTYNIMELAGAVQRVANRFGLSVEIRNIGNPRVEAEEHYYNPDHQNLLDLGYQPSYGVRDELEGIFNTLLKHCDRIEAKRDVLLPKIRWMG